MRGVVVAVVVAVVLTACGSRTGDPLAVEDADPSPSPSVASSPEPAPAPSPAPSSSPAAEPSAVAAADDTEDGTDVLKSCSGSGGVTTELVLAGDGPRPSDAEIDAGLADRSDLEELVRHLEAEGASTADARHAAYAQVLADAFFTYAQSFPNYVEGRVGGYPSHDSPFGVTFAGAVPDEFDPSGFDLESYGLEVTSGVGGTYEDVFSEAFGENVYDAVRAAGLIPKDFEDDITDGTLTVSVVQATPEQVAAFEAALDEPDRVCLVRVEPDVPCDDDVVAAAQEEARRQGEVVTGTSSEDADAVRRSHLGLTADESRAKAEQEDRAWRIEVQEGVSFALTMDAQPGRLGVTICQGIVVDARMEFFD